MSIVTTSQKEETVYAEKGDRKGRGRGPKKGREEKERKKREREDTLRDTTPTRLTARGPGRH